MAGKKQGQPQYLLGHGHHQAQASGGTQVKLSLVNQSAFRVPTDKELGMTMLLASAPGQKTANSQNDMRALTVGDEIEA